MNPRAPMQYLALLVVVALLGGCGSEKPSGPFDPAGSTGTANASPNASGSTGRIRGIVRFQGSPPAPATDAITADQNVCGTGVSLPRLALGKDNGVRHAFVYLEGVKATGDFRPQQSLLIDQRDCQYVPHAMTIAPGAKIEITNSDPILHNVHAKIPTEDGLQTVFNIAQAKRGDRTPVGSPFTKPGIVHLSCEAGHPWMSAYVFVADHPFVAITNEHGEFVIEGVPPGKHTIKMWHEGVTLLRNLKSLQRYEYEEPYEATQEVVVEAGAEAVIDFSFSLRSSS